MGPLWEGQSHILIVKFFQTIQSRSFKRDNRSPLKFLPTPLWADAYNSVIGAFTPRVQSLVTYRADMIISPLRMFTHLIFIICYYPYFTDEKNRGSENEFPKIIQPVGGRARIIKTRSSLPPRCLLSALYHTGFIQ